MQSIAGSNVMMHPSLASIGQYGGPMTPVPSFAGSLSQHPTSSSAVDLGVGGTMARTSSTLSKASAAGKKVKVKQADGTYKIMVVGTDGKAHPIRGASSEPISRSPSAGGLGAPSSGADTPNATAARSPSAAARKIVKRPPSPSAAGLFPIANLPPPSPAPQQLQQPYLSTPFQQSQSAQPSLPTMLIPASQAGLSWRDRFTRFYQLHAPDKMEKVETCMTMEAGPQAVMDALEKKYGPEPPVLVPAPNLAASATQVPPLYGQQNASVGVHPYALLSAPVGSGAATPDPRASSVTSRSPSVATTTRMVRKLVKKAAPKPSAAKISEAPPPASGGGDNTNENLPPMENLEDVLGAKESTPTPSRPAAAATKTKKKAESGGSNKKPQGAASRALGALLQNLKASSSDSDSDSATDGQGSSRGGKGEDEGPPLAAATVSPRTAAAPPEGPATSAKIASLTSPAQIKRSRSSDSDSSEEGTTIGNNKVSPPSTPSAQATSGAVPTLTAPVENGQSGGEKLKASPKTPQSHPALTPPRKHGSESDSDGEPTRQISRASDPQNNNINTPSSTPNNNPAAQGTIGKPPSSVVVKGSGRQVVGDAKKTSASLGSSSSSSSMDGVSATARAALASTPTRRPTVNSETVASHREHDHGSGREQARLGESSTSSAPNHKPAAASSSISDCYHGGNSVSSEAGNHQKTMNASASRPHEGPPSSIRASTPPRGRNALAQQSAAATSSSATAAAARERLQKSPGPTPWPLRSYTPDRSRLAHSNANNNTNNHVHSGTGHSRSLSRQGSTSRVPSVAPSANATPMRGGGGGGSVTRRRPPPAVRDAPHIKIVDRSTFSPNIEKPPTPDELFGIKRSEVRCPVRIGPPPSSSKRPTAANRDRYGSAQRRRSEERVGGEAADELDGNGTSRSTHSRSNTPNGEMARRASIALGDLTYKKMRGDELGEAARALHRSMKNSKYSYFDGLSADYFSTFPSKSSPQSQRPSSWALSPSGRGNGAVIAGIQKKLLIAKKEEEQRSPSRGRGGGDDTDDRAAREGPHRDSRGYDSGGASAAYDMLGMAREGDGYATQPRRLYTTSYLGRGDSYAATRGGYTDPYGHQDESHDSHHKMNGVDLTVADLISNSRRIIRTARGLSLEDGTAEELETFGAGGKSSGRSGGGGAGAHAAPVGIDSMDGVDEIIFEKEIPPPPGRTSSSLGGYGSSKDSVRRRAQTIVRRDEVVCVLREIPHSAEEVRRQRELSDRLSKPRNLYVSRDVAVAGGGGSKRR